MPRYGLAESWRVGSELFITRIPSPFLRNDRGDLPRLVDDSFSWDRLTKISFLEGSYEFNQDDYEATLVTLATLNRGSHVISVFKL